MPSPVVAATGVGTHDATEWRRSAIHLTAVSLRPPSLRRPSLRRLGQRAFLGEQSFHRAAHVQARGVGGDVHEAALAQFRQAGLLSLDLPPRRSQSGIPARLPARSHRAISIPQTPPACRAWR